MGVSEVMIWLLLHVYFSISKGNFLSSFSFFLKVQSFTNFSKIWYKRFGTKFGSFIKIKIYFIKIFPKFGKYHNFVDFFNTFPNTCLTAT